MARKRARPAANHHNAIDFAKLMKKKGLQNAYVLMGPETFLRREVCHKIRRQAFEGELDSPSYSEYDGESSDLANILDDARTRPFFGHGHRVVVVKNGGALFEPAKASASKDQASQREREIGAVFDYLAKPVSTSTLILCLDSVDKRRKQSKVLLQHDPIILCERPSSAALLRWVKGLASAPPFAQGAAENLIERCANGQIGLGQLASEVAKLENLAKGQPQITKKLVQTFVVKSSHDSFFDLLGRINSGRVGAALEMVHQMLKDGADGGQSGKKIREPSAMTSLAIGALSYDLRRLWKAKSHLEAGKRGSDLKAALGGAWRAEEVIRRAQKTTVTHLEARHRALQNADQKIRSGIPATESLLALVLALTQIAQAEQNSQK